MIDLDNQTTLIVNLEVLEQIASSLSSKEVELLIVDDATMQSLNLEHRGKDTTTDVLSFPMIDMKTPFPEQSIVGLPLGSIVISASTVTQKAKELGHSVQDETALLFIHGMLHLLGFDHEVDEGEMRDKEKALILEFDLPKSLIIRTGE